MSDVTALRAIFFAFLVFMIVLASPRNADSQSSIRIDTLPSASALTGLERMIVEQSDASGAHTRKATLDTLKGHVLAGTVAVSGVAVSGKVSARSSASTGFVVSVPLTGGTVVIGDQDEEAIADPAGPLANLTFQLPTCSDAYLGKVARYVSEKDIATLTVTATAGTVLNAPASLVAGAGNAYRCYGVIWYRLY